MSRASDDITEIGGFSPARTLNAISSPASSLRGSAFLPAQSNDERFVHCLDGDHPSQVEPVVSAIAQKGIHAESSVATLRGDFRDGKEKEVIVKEEVVDGDTPEDILEARERLSASGDGVSILYVDWDGPDDPQNPKNWPTSRKWLVTIIVSGYTFISPVASSIIAPAAKEMAKDLGITNSTVMGIATSIFVMGFGLGPLIFAPLSEIYGRVPILLIANAWFFAFNLACGFAQNTGQIVALRFLAGVGGSSPLAIGGGVLGDCWKPEERGQAIGLFSLGPLLGPVIGPIAGAWVAQKSTWRWVFWSSSIVTVAIQIAGHLFLYESYAPVILEKKAKIVERNMDFEKGAKVEVRAISSGDRDWKAIISKALVRPFRLFFSEPIAQFLGIYMAFIYGLLYLFLTTIDGIFERVYHQPIGIAGLHYISLGLGIAFVCILWAKIMDPIYQHYQKKNGGKGRPEYRLPLMVPGTILLPIGLFITGWTARSDVHWIVPDIGILLVGAGNIANFQSIQSYVIDAFTLHAASALAAVLFLRALAGFGFPLFAPVMYNALGYGKGNTILAAFAIVVGCPAPWFFWYYGQRLRKASKYAE